MRIGRREVGGIQIQDVTRLGVGPGGGRPQEAASRQRLGGPAAILHCLDIGGHAADIGRLSHRQATMTIEIDRDFSRRERVVISIDQRLYARGESHFEPCQTVRAMAANSYRFLAECALLSD